MFTRLFLLFFCASSALAQVERQHPPLFNTDGTAWQTPWLGGLNNPQVQQCDLNGDGVQDLLVFDRAGDYLLPFLRQNNQWVFAPEFQESFPDLQDWVILRDYNCDGLQDIFASARSVTTGGLGVRVWKAERLAWGGLRYEQQVDILTFPLPNGFRTNLYVSGLDIPGIADVDADGDLDILTFNIGGGYMEWYQNQSQEQGFGCDSLLFELKDDCWGRFYESGLSVSVDLSNDIDSCVGRSNWAMPQRQARHSGSTALPWDLNGDNLQELLLGDVGFSQLLLLRNGGSANKGFMTAQDPNFPSNSQSVFLDAFPAAFRADADADGLQDLLVAPAAENISQDRYNLWFYRNVQSNSQPLFQLENDSFLVGDMLDVGSLSLPSLADLNGDGLLDLIVGNAGAYVGNGAFESELYYFENTGAIAQPAFQLVEKDLAQLRQYGRPRLAPSFGDLDADGDLDMMLGQEDGTLFYLENTGTATAPAFASPFPNYANIDVGQHSMPQLFDVDEDGDLDLIIGERNGNINFYENTGTASLPSFSDLPTSQSFGFIDTKPAGLLAGNSAPQLAKQDGEIYCFVGQESGVVWQFDQVRGNLSGAFSSVDSLFGNINEGQRSSIAVGDVDQDGQLDVIVGNQRGGLAYFAGQALVSSRESPSEPLLFYPNPSRGNIQLDNPLEEAELEVYNNLGQCVWQRTLPTGQQQVSLSLPAGSYWLRLSSEKRQLLGKMLLME